MPSNDLIPNFAPPAGGLAKLMGRIDAAESRGRWAQRRYSLYGGLLAGGLAAALAVVFLPHSSTTLADLVRSSEALHLYKYGLKTLPTEAVRLQGPSGTLIPRQTDYGYSFSAP